MPVSDAPAKAACEVIFTGDDFGAAPAVNAAVVGAHRHGLLTCASLMAGGPAWQQAVALARDCPDLCVGVHLTLIQGQAVLPRRQIPGLVDHRGNFPKNPVAAGCYYFFARRVQQQLAAELAAQVERLLAAGVRLWFVNGHLNIHLHPAVWPLVRRLAREYGIPAVRLAKEDLDLTLSLDRRRRGAKIVHAWIFAWLSRRAAATLGPLRANDHLFGLLNDGAMEEHFLLGVLPRLAPGVTEIYCHPAVAGAGPLPPWPTFYRPEAELAALTSPRVAACLQAQGGRLISYRDLAAPRPGQAGEAKNRG